jgi:uncharacterized protein YutE (UPF0331/DUF86 family)
MVISRLHVEKIERSLSVIQEFLAELKSLSDMPKEDFLADKRNPAAAESYLRRSIEAMFDIGRHILAKSYGLKELEYKKIAQGLGDKGVVDREYAAVLLKIAGYRNRLVHFVIPAPVLAWRGSVRNLFRLLGRIPDALRLRE